MALICVSILKICWVVFFSHIFDVHPEKLGNISHFNFDSYV